MPDYEYYNGLMLELVSRYLNFSERAVTKAQIEQLTELGIDGEKAFRRLFASHLGVRDGVLLSEYLPRLCDKLDAESYRRDDYYSHIVFPEKTQGGWKIGKGRYEPYELFVCDDFKLDGGKVLPALGYFAEAFDYPAVYENGVLWMSVTPNEINTMREPISRACGRVLTFGLGLGYYAYMCSQKPEVESVTVVERDKNVISLFTGEILPQFPNADKINIIAADAYAFLAGLGDGEYDTAFVDIYHDAGDGREVYKRFKSRTFTRTRFDYWIENTIKYYTGEI